MKKRLLLGIVLSALHISNSQKQEFCRLPKDEEKTYPVDVKEACHFKHLVGGCSGRYLRYYYDSAYDKCKRFIWTGCFGNGNRFFDYKSCNTTCAGMSEGLSGWIKLFLAFYNIF
ncbi:hypothetical protein XENORESO_000737 [Xenotaenia resolanae]|uniref:BPTI/Kunitz inhibitor domain-containing protein n=1 Tax=Xenotaenia resolanae TaxID=208358 RepID=A0ABV0VN26_9TELE